MDFTPPFGAWEKERRRQLDLTQEDLARKAHYSTVAIHRVESGSLRPSRAMAEALAVAPGRDTLCRCRVAGTTR